MPKYLIAYQLYSEVTHDNQSQEPRDIPAAIYSIDAGAINVFGSAFDSNWIINSDLSAPEIRHRIGRLMGAGDRVIVATIANLELEGFGLVESERLLK
jgi:hypothetical protein